MQVDDIHGDDMRRLDVRSQECARRHIALIGLPGAGKSTVGLMVARLICRPFFDSDTALGLPPAHRVARDATHDAAERAWFERVAGARQPAVIAAPAALLTSEIDDTWAHALWVVWLDVSPSTLAGRLRHDAEIAPDAAPRVATSPEETSAASLRERCASMAGRLCDVRLDVDDLDGFDAARAIAAHWRVACAESVLARGSPHHTAGPTVASDGSIRSASMR
jgi:shikimate kinase/shikimate kinase/3-dehydroquinate synthase